MVTGKQTKEEENIPADMAGRPKLRFGGFVGDWEEKKLGEVCDVRDGTHDSPRYQRKGFPLITSKNLQKDGSIDFSNVNLISSEDYEAVNKRSKVSVGDILFGMIGTIGNPVIVRNEGFAIKNVALIKEQSELKNKFLWQYLKSVYTEKQFHRKNTGGTQKFIALGVIRDLDIPTPSITEQEKIAGFLGVVDEWVGNLKEQKGELEDYKRGVMQGIFSVGSVVGVQDFEPLRFRDGNGDCFCDWEERKLGEILKIGNGRDHKSLGNGNIPVFGTGGYMRSVNEKLGNGETVFIGRKGTINKPFYHEGDFWTVDTLFYTHDYKNVLPKFVLLLFQQINWLKYNEASGVPSLSKKTIEKIKISLPSLSEQKRIADFLCSLDDLIQLKQEEIDKAEEWKRGLMQGLFV